MSKETVVYLLGVLALGFFYGPLKQWAPNGTIFVLMTVIYLLALRVIGGWLNRG
jgi:hypothetical protein